ncbi:hypothetical protein I6M90_21530 [Acinetobacter bereziniae]|uniref:hypothetical protein n=1 Tax=Acinetobacter bereziniae TaxID=106648 RepID=UPI001901664A|nr:hypothetical protein [Acinetobacter bereziniae]MBJ8454314.1 hypothetical protein [Acinetobacter bereziniae]MBJ8458625.1 hypothetical protein [Acinetobacter bereziniae]
MNFFILLAVILSLSACSFDSNKDNCSLTKSENIKNGYDVRVGRDISSFIENNKIYLNYDQNEIIKRYFELNSHYLILKVLDGLPPEIGFSDGTVNNSVKRNFDYISHLSVNSSLKGNHIFFSSDNYVPYSEQLEEEIMSMIKDQIYVVSGNKVATADLNSKVNAFIRELHCSDSNIPEVEEWNINDMHIILEADGKQIKNRKYNSLNFFIYFARKTDKKYETSIY